MSFFVILLTLSTIIFGQACGKLPAESTDLNSTDLAKAARACGLINQVVSAPCSSNSKTNLSATVQNSILRPSQSGFDYIPVQGFCNNGTFANNHVQARIYNTAGQLVAQSPVTTCVSPGQYSARLPATSAVENQDFYLEVEIVGIETDGRIFRNLPKSKARVYISGR